MNTFTAPTVLDWIIFLRILFDLLKINFILETAALVHNIS